MKAKDLLIRYSVSTLGLVLVALGVALSIKSNFGIAPPSCPPSALSQQWPSLSFGTYTWIFNCSFIVIQLLLRPRRFDWILGIMQVLAVLLFGYLCDFFNWVLAADVPAWTLWMQVILTALAIVATAVGIKLEVLGKGWLLPIDQMNAVITDMGHFRYSNVKIACDVVMVSATALFCLLCFGSLLGSPSLNIVYWGTVLLAFGVGLCMKLTDPLMDRIFGRFVK